MVLLPKVIQFPDHLMVILRASFDAHFRCFKKSPLLPAAAISILDLFNFSDTILTLIKLKCIIAHLAAPSII